MPQTVTPVLSRITADVVSTLQDVDTTSYSLTLHVTEPDAVTGTETKDGRCVVTLGGVTRVEEGVPQAMTKYIQSYDLTIVRIRSESNTTPISELLALAAADVTRAIAEDITRGGLAEDTIIEAPSFEYASKEANSGVVVVPVLVHYQTYYNNPFRSRYESD